MPRGGKNIKSRKRSIVTSFRIAIGLLVACASLGVATISVALQSKEELAETRENAVRIAEASAIILSDELDRWDDTRVLSVMEKIAQSNRIIGLGYYSPDGEKLLETDTPIHSELHKDIVQAALTRNELVYRGLWESAYTAAPFMHNGEIAGVLVMEASRKPISALIWSGTLWAGLATLISVAVALPLADLIIRRLTSPISKLTDFAEQMNVRRMSNRIDLKTGNEFELVGDAFNDMIERLDSSMRRIQKLAFSDTVTGLANRERFNKELEAVFLSRQPNQNIGIMLLDIERFRWINETMGPERGDQALKVVGKRLHMALTKADQAFRSNDKIGRSSLVARIGPDEFGIFVPSVQTKDQLGRILQLLTTAIKHPIELAGHKLTLGVTGGLVIGPQDGSTGAELFKNAELAIKEAKREGAGKVRFFTKKLRDAAQDRLRLENEIRNAIDNKEFVAAFQPKVDFRTGEIVGAEALARWRRPNGEMISPGIFIPLAEELGIVGGIGDIIMEDACREATRWMSNGFDTRVAVNVSPIQFEDAGFADKVLDRLREAGLPPGRLELEITETMAVSDPEKVSEITRPLRAMGVRLAIDDFGAGHSNLMTLTQLPFDVFKIDQQFVRALHSDRQAPAIVETILAMAKAMQLETVAEGVETQSQSDFLRRRGCTIAQGYLYSPPVSADEFLEFLNNWQPFGAKDNKIDAFVI